MIVLDTNVLSELMKTAPDEAVVRWLDEQPSTSIWTTAITIYEIEFGLQRLPAGKRRDILEGLFREVVANELHGRILSLDTEAALASGALSAALQSAGKTVDIRDVMIAGIARTHHAKVATRNVTDFEDSCEAINPWAAS